MITGSDWYIIHTKNKEKLGQYLQCVKIRKLLKNVTKKPLTFTQNPNRINHDEGCIPSKMVKKNFIFSIYYENCISKVLVKQVNRT